MRWGLRFALRFGTVDRVDGPRRSDRGGDGLWLKDRCWVSPRERTATLLRRHRRGRAHLPQRAGQDAPRRVVGRRARIAKDRTRLTIEAGLPGGATNKAGLVSHSSRVSHGWCYRRTDGLKENILVVAFGLAPQNTAGSDQCMPRALSYGQ